jgi:exopolyphosphatase / guanosine-5'-triphosphate,3'-diphosphate pyrophosphatase
MEFLKFGAIDIGSNALRLLITDVQEYTSDTRFKKISLVRVPIRLGKDVFTNKEISPHSENRLIKALSGFKNLLEAFEVIDYRACATSAMREAKNGEFVVERIKKEAGINLEIISGQDEAEILYSTKIADVLSPDKSYIYVDVGGGSTEITLFSKGKIVSSYSFGVGTIRILSNQVSQDDWTFMKSWVKANTIEYQPIGIIGSGGNINKMHKLLNKKENEPIYFPELRELHRYIKAFTYDERIDVLKLNPHRADVIVPAAKIFLTIAKSSNSRKIHVPKIGIADGLIHQLYDQYKLDNAD